MERYRERDLGILTAIGEGHPLTQRALAQRLGVALGLTNLYLKRLASKGLIKITEFPRKPSARKRLRYVLTPKGLLEKSRLTYEYMSYSLAIYRRTRETLREALGHLLHGQGLKRIAFYHTGEAAELAYVTLKELGLEPVAVLMAPILDLALGAPAGAAGGDAAAGLSLRNLGAAVSGWLSITSVEDRFRAIIVLCAVYVGAGFLKGWIDFGSYLLALWIRVRAAAALQRDLFRHLLGL